MENEDINKGIEMASEPAVAYGSVRSCGEMHNNTIRSISRAQLEEETITVNELDRRLTAFIEKHFEIA